jgi:phosphoribosylglycinamide formyltransferase-1
VSEPLRVAVLASGRGSNLEAILEAGRHRNFPARVVLVVSDRERARALDVAAAQGVLTVFLNAKDFGDRDAYDAALGRLLDEHRIGLVCLAGFMRILGRAFVRAWQGRLMNIHPSLLPAFPGLHPQRQALAHGAKITGATVHFVDEGIDTGPIILQSSVPVEPGDTEDALAARILTEEHRIYPQAVRLFAEGRLRIVGRQVVVEG